MMVPKTFLATLLASSGALASPVALPETDNNATTRDVDAVLPPTCGTSTRLDGDGNPHQNYLHVQVTEPITCGAASCSVSHLDSHTISWSANGGVGTFITGGFGVSESFTTGGTYTCSADPGQSVCVVHAIAHTAYTVFDTAADCGDHGPFYVMKSPNSNEVGYHYFCKTTGCGSSGDQVWDDGFGPAGGPGPQARCIGAECG